MEKIPQRTYSLKNNFFFVLLLAIFSLLFVVIYVPTFGYSSSQIERWNEHKDMCIPILSAIILLSASFSRGWMLLLTRKNGLTEFEYLVWQLCEIVVISLFADIFVSLFFHLGFFEVFPRLFLFMLAVLIYPYALYWLYIERRDRDSRILEAEAQIASLRQGMEQDSNVMRFVDEKGNAKLMVAAEHVIYIESAGNYVTILYEDGGKLIRFALRNTLKGIEALCEANNLVRAHRSYFINLRHIKLLRKDSSGVYAEMNVSGVDDMVVSKNYAADVAQRFSNQV